MPFLYMSNFFLLGGQTQMLRDLLSAARLHPFIDLFGVDHDLGDRAVKAEEPIGQVERITGLGERPQTAHQIGPTAAHHDIDRRWAVSTEMLPQSIAHCAESLVYVGVVRLAANDEQHIGLLE